MNLNEEEKKKAKHTHIHKFCELLLDYKFIITPRIYVYVKYAGI